jgi:hypothetical protein
MVVAIPLPRHSKLLVAWTRPTGLRSVLWRAGCGDVPPSGDDAEGGAGVREPCSPRPPRRGGAIALDPGDLH